jgi:hypothetical protein
MGNAKGSFPKLGHITAVFTSVFGVTKTSNIAAPCPPDDLPIEGRIFLKIWISIFISQLSTFFLLITLSAITFAATHSALASNAIVLTQWLPAVLALPLIRAVNVRYSPRIVLIAADAACAAILPLVSAVSESLYPLLALLLVKGSFDALSKVARPVALRSYFSGDRLDRSAAYYNIAALAGNGLGALCGAVAYDMIGLKGVLVVCITLHVIASLIYGSLPRIVGSGLRKIQGSIAFSALDRRVQASFIYFVAAICVFQGYHNIARAVYPTLQLGMTEAGIGFIQMVTSFTYVVGAVLAAQVVLSKRRYDIVGPLFHIVALLSLAPIPFMSAKIPGLAAYALFALSYELTYCIHLRYLIVACPAAHLPQLVASANAWGLGLMVGFSLIGSYAVGLIGLPAITFIFLVAAVIVLIAVEIWPIGQKRNSNTAAEVY